MLALSRRESEGVVLHRGGVVIGRVLVLERKLGSGSARLGFSFPEEIEVDRDEVFLKRYPDAKLPGPPVGS